MPSKTRAASHAVKLSNSEKALSGVAELMESLNRFFKAILLTSLNSVLNWCCY